MEFFILWVILVIAVGIIAGSKNRSAFGWVALSVILTPLVGIILLCLPTKEASVTSNSQAKVFSIDNETKKCPVCAEAIKLEAKKCHYCGEEFNDVEVKRQVDARRVELARLAEGKKQCPECKSWDVYRTVLWTGTAADYCPHCKKPLKKMRK